jgi:ketosteroid isomerase-like protein
LTSDNAPLSHQIVARYFEMWNTGDPSIGMEILSPAWMDHAHPEVTGRHGVQRAVEQIRAAQPDLRFHVETMLGDGDLVAVVGSVGRNSRSSPAASRLIWLIRLEDGQLAEMWTYRDTSS